MASVRLALGRPERLTRGRRALLAGLTAVVAFAYVSLFLREDLWIDTLWIGLAATVVFTVSYLIVRRAVVAFAAAVLLVAAGSWAMTPRLAGQRTGDSQLLTRLTALDGYHGLAVAVVDLHATPRVRFANIGSTTTTRFELGSLAKPMTGLVIADAVDRGEIDLASPVSAYLPLRGSAAGAATMRQLVSHTAGYPRDGAAYNRKVLRDMPIGRNPNTADLDQTLRDIREAVLSPAGTVSYSNLGGAAAGQATAAAAGLSYPDLMRTRLFGPMRMTDTAVQTTPMVSGGRRPRDGPSNRGPWTGSLPPAGSSPPRPIWPCWPLGSSTAPRPAWAR
jgi:CubicO group peptidase (beta-lactamase class C family)